MDVDVFDTSTDDSSSEASSSPVNESQFIKSENGAESIGDDEPLKCQHCSETFADWLLLRKHEESHRTDDFFLSFVLISRLIRPISE